MQYHRREDCIRAHVFLCVLSFLLRRMLEKSLKDEMAIARMAESLSELKAIPVRVHTGIITMRSDSQNARNILEKMNMPYPGRILDSVPT